MTHLRPIYKEWVKTTETYHCMDIQCYLAVQHWSSQRAWFISSQQSARRALYIQISLKVRLHWQMKHSKCALIANMNGYLAICSVIHHLLTNGTRQEQTQRYITHTTTNTQPTLCSVLIKGMTKFECSKNALWMIQDRLFQIEFAFNYWNISAYLLKKWIYYCEIIMLRNHK